MKKLTQEENETYVECWFGDFTDTEVSLLIRRDLSYGGLFFVSKSSSGHSDCITEIPLNWMLTQMMHIIHPELPKADKIKAVVNDKPGFITFQFRNILYVNSSCYFILSEAGANEIIDALQLHRGFVDVSLAALHYKE